jgi:tetratricopeptide (TPR) repeat protein
MTSKVPFIKQEINWLAIVPRLFLISILCFVFYHFLGATDKHNFFIFAFIVYLLIAFALRKLFLPLVLHQGIQLIKEEKFEQAIPFIQKTVDYYTKNSWIDKFRFLLLISSSKSTIRESSICNLAYCYLQIGETKKSREIYQGVLTQYPKNKNAKSMLNTINILSTDSNLT